MTTLIDLRVKIFADGADLNGILEMAKLPYIKGFTTNPTLMRKAGVSEYERFARDLLTKITVHPVSFEVFADDLPTMIAQGRTIASWGSNVNVKVPVMNTKGEFTGPVLKALASEGVVLNVFQADAVGCDIITCTNDMIAKLKLAGKDLTAYSRETVEMFYKDATAAAYSIERTKSAA